MRINVNFEMQIDPNANYLTLDEWSNLEALEDLISSALYDIDDAKLLTIEVEAVD